MDCDAGCTSTCFRNLCKKIHGDPNLIPKDEYFVIQCENGKLARLHRKIIGIGERLSFCPKPDQLPDGSVHWDLDTLIPSLESHNLHTCQVHTEYNAVTNLNDIPTRCYRAIQAAFYGKISIENATWHRVNNWFYLRTPSTAVIVDRRHLKKDLGPDLCPAGRKVDCSTTTWYWPTNTMYVR